MSQLEMRAPALGQVPLWNSDRSDYPRHKTIAELFEETAAVHSESIALTLENRVVTYAALNNSANRLARRLRSLGVGREVMVGCCIERSVELIVALIGILKAGAAYVPLDPAYPIDRLKFFLNDTRAKLVLTDEASRAALENCCPADCRLLDVGELLAPGPDEGNLPPQGGPQTLAYVMYTSGSTGVPKGVMIENRAVVRLVRNTNFCQLGPSEVFLQFAPTSFDASTFEIWGPLLNGGRLVIAPPAKISLEELGQIIRKQGVTTLWLTSGLFNLMVEERLEDLRGVRQLLAGGDVLSARHVRLLLEKIPDCVLINGYGPTENTTFTCCHIMRAGDKIPASVPIGRPISNSGVYILDEELLLVPPGSVGELCAAGDGLARGYLNDPEATDRKFIKDPFNADDESRIYRTGDLARIGDDGLIEFLGRKDNQIKINGHRIEPAEVEATLEAHEKIKQSCVLVSCNQASGSKFLVAYYVPRESQVDAAGLRSFLSGRLPQHMIPAVFVPQESFPLTSNGKLDRAALAAAHANVRGGLVEEAPTGDLERTIIGVWCEVLGVDRIDPKDNFFDLGGNSLLLLAMHATLENRLEVQIPITKLFEFNSPQALATYLGGGGASSLSFSQQRAEKQRAAFSRHRQRRTRT